MVENTNTGTPNYFRLTFNEIEELYEFMRRHRSPSEQYQHIDLYVFQTGFSSAYEARYKENTKDITDYDSF